MSSYLLRPAFPFCIYWLMNCSALFLTAPTRILLLATHSFGLMGVKKGLRGLHLFSNLSKLKPLVQAILPSVTEVRHHGNGIFYCHHHAPGGHWG